MRSCLYELGISLETVRNNVRAIFTKLALGGLTQVMLKASASSLCHDG